jgi:uncharacterized membrane protein YccF (DUF307 family)
MNQQHAPLRPVSVQTGTDLASGTQSPLAPTLSGAFAPAKRPTQHVSMTTNVAAPAIHLSMQTRQLPFLLRALWFLFVGWWLSALFITIGYAFVVLIVTIPFGLYILHRVPQAQTLRQRTLSFRTQASADAIYFTEGTQAQHPWWLRALYFVVAGWWLTAIWLALAWAISLLVLTLPLSVWMVDRTPGLLTLQRH